MPDFFSKVSAVAGDCALPGLGLNDAERRLLVRNVQVRPTSRYIERQRAACARVT